MSDSNSTISELPNAFTPLAFLDPKLSNQFEVSRYLYAVTLGIYIWDVAINLPNDYKLLFKYSIRLPTIVYYLSRVSALCFVLTSFVFQVGRVPDCQALQYALGAFWVLSETLTSFLFFLRVRAVYHRNKFVKAVFFVLWLSVFGTSFTVPIGIRGAHIGPTQQCINVVVPKSTEASTVTLLVNDSAVFFAITYKILVNNIIEEGFKARVKAFFGRGSIPHLSRTLLLSGQHYYLIALCGNIVLVTLVTLPNLPAVYHGMCTVPLAAVTNLMACIVFRKIRFGHISHDGTMHINTFHISSSGKNDVSAPRYRNRFRADDDSSYTLDNGAAATAAEIHVEVSRSIETEGQLDYVLKDMKVPAHAAV